MNVIQKDQQILAERSGNICGKSGLWFSFDPRLQFTSRW